MPHGLDWCHEEKDIASATKLKIADVYKSHESLRSHMSDEGNLTWQSTWPQSALLLGRLIEEVVYGNQYDSSIKFGTKTKKEAEEIMGLSALSEALHEIDEQLTSEKEAAANSAAAVEDESGSEAGDGGSAHQQVLEGTMEA